MVAKQGWKIMTKPDTLVARIFKARWNIGDGSKIKVMSDPWLRGQGRGWLSAPQPQAGEILAVPLIREVEEDRLVWKEEQHGGNESIMARQQGKLGEFCNVKGIHVSAWLAAKGRTTAQVALRWVKCNG
ncbi:alcohol dehydrogenase (NADP(+)) [Trifolium repens]|nr:alcohol dehydrogenase (NADP(+)) [Trifolium repens]